LHAVLLKTALPAEAGSEKWIKTRQAALANQASAALPDD
jgi:hypothetical protein